MYSLFWLEGDETAFPSTKAILVQNHVSHVLLHNNMHVFVLKYYYYYCRF